MLYWGMTTHTETERHLHRVRIVLGDQPIRTLEYDVALDRTKVDELTQWAHETYGPVTLLFDVIPESASVGRQFQWLLSPE